MTTDDLQHHWHTNLDVVLPGLDLSFLPLSLSLPLLLLYYSFYSPPTLTFSSFSVTPLPTISLCSISLFYPVFGVWAGSVRLIPLLSSSTKFPCLLPEHLSRLVRHPTFRMARRK